MADDDARDVADDDARDVIVDPDDLATGPVLHADRLAELLGSVNVGGCQERFAPMVLAQLVPAEHLHALEIIGISEAGELFRPSARAIDDELLAWVMGHLWGRPRAVAELARGKSIVRRGPDRRSALLCLPLIHEGRMTAVLACSVSAESEGHLARIIEGMTKISRLCSSLDDHTIADGIPSPTTSGGLTPRQQLVLEAMRDGLTNRQIAARIAFSESTVRMESMAIYRHFGVHSREEAVAAAFGEPVDPQRQPSIA